jgi:hypothetical protein
MHTTFSHIMSVRIKLGTLLIDFSRDSILLTAFIETDLQN